MRNSIRESYVQQKSWIDDWLSYIGKINPCLRPQQQSEELSRFLSNFTQISLYHDPYFGQCYLLESNTHNTLKIVRKEVHPHLGNAERDNVINQIQGFNAGSNVVEQKEICRIQKKGFLWTTTEIYLAYDYILVDLEKQFENRITKGEKFSESELIVILKETVKGLVHLEATTYSSIRMKNIYFCQNSIKVAHPKLFNYQSNLAIILEDEHTKGVYLGPQEMISLEKGEKNANYGWRANSYAFGMVILSLMNMQYLNQLYDYDGCQIMYSKVNELLSHARKSYSEKIIKLVEGLLKQRPQDRFTFRNILNKLAEKYEPEKNIQLTLIQENIKLKNQYKPIPQPTPQIHHTNYLAGLIYPKVGITGQYLDYDKGKRSSIQNVNDPVIANHRYYYGATNSRYVGDSVQQVIGSKEHPIRQGKGIYRNEDGQLYVGQWKKGEMDGFGKLYWDEHKIRYEGEFKQGKFEGKGIEYPIKSERDNDIDYSFVRMQNNNWVKYEGYYKNDKRQGQGTVYFHSGKWVGNFKNDQPTGQGIFYDHDAKQYSGTYLNGMLQM